MRITGNGVNNVRTEGIEVTDERWIRTPIERDRFFHAIVADPESAANDKAVVQVLMEQRQSSRTPRKTDLRSEIVIAGVVEIPAYFESKARQRIRECAEDRVADVPIFFADWTEVLPAQTKINREIGFDLEIILNEERINVRADIFSRVGRLPGLRIEVSIFLLRRVVQKILDVIERVSRPGRARLDVNVLFLIDVGAKLYGVVAEDLRKRVAGKASSGRGEGSESCRRPKRPR
jgi:hypothetical protein